MFPYGYLLSKKNIEQHEYVIRRRSHDVWYFVSIITTYSPMPVVWSGQLIKARTFNTEEQVEEFKYVYLSDRLCDIIKLK